MMNTKEQERIDRFEGLRSELADLNDEALKAGFRELCHQVMEPVVKLAHIHAIPSTERSVLLRMGIDSIITHAVVENVLNIGLLGEGAGHVVLRLSGRDGIDIRVAAIIIADDPVVMAELFKEK